MEENKNEILEEGITPEEEAVEETVEETVEEIVEDVIEEAAVEEAFEEAEEDFTEAEKYLDTNLFIDEIAELRMENESLRKSNNVLKGVLGGILAVALAVILAFGGMTAYKTLYNPYNHMGYYNISGMTLEDVAAMNNMSIEEAKEMLNLPDDVKGNTYYDVVEFLIPVSQMAEMYGADVETLKEVFSLGEEITAESTWGEAIDSMPLSVYLGSEEMVAEFVAEYNLGDEVTGETLWGEIRKTVNKIDYERHLAQMATDATYEG